MKASKLAEWLLNREDGEVYLMKDNKDAKLKNLEIGRKLLVNGIVTAEDGDIYLIFRGELTKEEDKEYPIKRAELEKTEGLKSVKTTVKDFPSEKARAEAILKEAQERGFNILPAYNPDKKRLGYVVYKDFDGVELAYNPEWPEEDGEMDGYPPCIYPQK